MVIGNMTTGTEEDYTHVVAVIGDKTHVFGKETLDTIKAASQPDGLPVKDITRHRYRARQGPLALPRLPSSPRNLA